MAEATTVDLSGNNTVDIGALGDLLNLVMERIETLEKAQPRPAGPTDEEVNVEDLVAALNIAIERAYRDGSRVTLTLDWPRSTTNELVCPQVSVEGWYRKP